MSSESLGQAVANNTNWINSVISNSKLASQLTELLSIDSLDQKINIQEGELDAQFVNAKTLRGYKGDWEADTNNPILSDNSGVVGDIYKVSIGGNIDIGSGSIDYVAGDLIYLSENNWIKISPNQISDITGLQLALDALADGLIPQGTWDATLNDPDIDGGIAETGYFWIVSVAGTTDVGGITDWEINDWAVKTAAGWAKIDNTDKVLSVAGRTGVIVLSITDITGLTTALANCVKLTGDQSIDGKKTFTEDLTATANQDIRGNLTIGTLRAAENESYALNLLDTNSVIAFGDNNLSTKNVIVGEYGTTDTDQLWLHGKSGTYFSHDGDGLGIAMVIDEDGRIGMGTPASGVHKLSVLGTTSLNGNVYLQDNNKILFGGGSDLQIYHNGTNSFIADGGTGNLEISSNLLKMLSPAGENMIIAQQFSSVRLYYNNSKKIETTTVGATITGSLTVTNKILGELDTTVIGTTQTANDNSTKIATTAYVDAAAGSGDYLPLSGGILTGNVKFQDNIQLRFGTSSDLQIYHDGSSSYIRDAGAGDLRIWANNPNISTLSGNKIFYGNNGVAELYYTGGGKRFLTTNFGIKVGNIDVLESDWLQVSKSANNARITNVSKNLLIQQSEGWVEIQALPNLSPMARFTVGGDVKLFQNGYVKLKTSNNGIDVIGSDTEIPYVTIDLDNDSSPEVLGEVFGGMRVYSGKTPNPGIKASAQFITGLNPVTMVLGAAFQVNVNQAGTLEEAFRINVGGNAGFGLTQPEAKIHVYDTNAEIRLEDPSTVIGTGFARVFTGDNNGLKLGAGTSGQTVVELTGDNRIMSLFGTLTFNNQDASYTGNQNYTYRIRPSSEGVNTLNPDLLFTKQDPGFGAEYTYMKITGAEGDNPMVQVTTNLLVDTTQSFLALSSDPSSHVIAMIDSNGGTDSGGLAIKTGDNNNDESALYILNYLNEAVFRVKGTNGNVLAKGDIEITTNTNGFILTAPNGTRWRQTISNTGVPTYTQA